MLANYGFEDGSGTYYISIDTDCCAECEEHPCMNVCPEVIYELIEDDDDNIVLAVKTDRVHHLKEVCASCKSDYAKQKTPCVNACIFNAIKHTW